MLPPKAEASLLLPLLVSFFRAICKQTYFLSLKKVSQLMITYIQGTQAAG